MFYNYYYACVILWNIGGLILGHGIIIFLHGNYYVLLAPINKL